MSDECRHTDIMRGLFYGVESSGLDSTVIWVCEACGQVFLPIAGGLAKQAKLAWESYKRFGVKVESPPPSPPPPVHIAWIAKCDKERAETLKHFERQSVALEQIADALKTSPPMRDSSRTWRRSRRRATVADERSRLYRH